MNVASAEPSPQVCELCVNLDDVSAEVVGSATQALLADGALDVWTTAIQMKKQRPGVMLSVLCHAAKQQNFAVRIIELTGSFGVRFRMWDRLTLDRRHETLATRFGDIRVKVGSLDGRVLVAQPEYEDVRSRAEISGRPVRDVLLAAQAAADAWLAQHNG